MHKVRTNLQKSTKQENKCDINSSSKNSTIFSELANSAAAAAAVAAEQPPPEHEHSTLRSL